MSSSSESLPEINPYRPTVSVSQQVPKLERDATATITNSRVSGQTIVAVGLSGTAFVVVLGGMAAAYLAFSMASAGRTGAIPGIAGMLAFFIIVGTLVGFFLAGFAAVLVVPSMMWLVGDSEAFGGRNWDRRSIRLFSAMCGTICGWGSLVVLSGLQPFAFLVGLAPAAVGLIATPLFLRRLLREADRIANPH